MNKLYMSDAGNGNPPPKDPPKTPKREPIAPLYDRVEDDAGNGNPPPPDKP